jgi:uncharacterized protein (TIGR02271 family)
MMGNAQGRPIETLTEDQVPELRNIPVYSGGEEIGHVGDIYYDDSTGNVACVGVKGGALGFSRKWIPAQGAMLQDDGLYLDYGRDQIEGGPATDGDADLDADTYQRMRTHFTRHEEELDVGKERTEVGSVRLRKWVETQPVSAEVELERETAHVTHEAIDQPLGRDTEGAFEEQEIDVPLEAEHAVVAKQVVAKERVGLEKGAVSETQTVEDSVRKERVDVDTDGDVDSR